MARTNSPQRILLVEDSPADVLLLRMAMEEAGIDVDLTVYEAGEAAIAYIGSGAPPPDLVILDFNLPCRDGLEILEVLRANDVWRWAPVIMFTSTATPAEQERIRDRAATFIRKPQSYNGFVLLAADLALTISDDRSAA